MRDIKTVVLSGGMDSAMALIDLVFSGEYPINAVTVNYGQINREYLFACILCRRLNSTFKMLFPDRGDTVRHFIVDESFYHNPYVKTKTPSSIVNSNILDHSAPSDLNSELIASFLPGRNILLLTLAAIAAYVNESTTLVVGGTVTDSNPDASPKFYRMMGDVLAEGLKESSFRVLIPWEGMLKPQALASIKDKKVKDVCTVNFLRYSWTCWSKSNSPLNVRGVDKLLDYEPSELNRIDAALMPRACGVCQVCKRRSSAFFVNGLEDPNPYHRC